MTHSRPISAGLDASTILFPVLMVLACESEAIELGQPDPVADAGEVENDSGEVSECEWPARLERPPLERKRISGDGCNECECRSGTDGFGQPGGVSCTLKACTPSVLRCTGQGECGETGFCHFDPGCTGEAGYCTQPQSACAREENLEASESEAEGVFCGCDDRTYRGTRCIGRPWAGWGPCGG